MEKDWTVLIDTMEQQIAVYHELLALATEKQEVLVKGDLPELEKITRVEEALILRVGRLEEARRNVHLALADRFSLSPDELTLAELVKRTDAPTSEKLQKVFEDISGVLKELVGVNDTNAQLIQNSLDLIDFSFNLLTETKSPGYGEPNRNRQPSSAMIFDRKV